jgi:hypothetical protein
LQSRRAQSRALNLIPRELKIRFDVRIARRELCGPAVGNNGTTPPLPIYRFPNKTEFNQARELGMENAYTVFENLGRSPTLVLLDERGIVRWHSEGVQEPTAGGEVSDPAQYTIIEAVKFSLEQL